MGKFKSEIIGHLDVIDTENKTVFGSQYVRSTPRHDQHQPPELHSHGLSGTGGPVPTGQHQTF